MIIAFYAAKIAIVTILWVILFALNHWLFGFVQVNEFVSWIFLPAALRMVSVLLFGWKAAVGLVLGAVLTGHMFTHMDTVALIPLALISGLGPLAAKFFTSRWLKVGSDLANLSAQHLWAYAFSGALVNAVISQGYLQSMKPNGDPWSLVFKMFLGDLVGSALALLLMSYCLSRFRLSQSLRA